MDGVSPHDGIGENARRFQLHECIGRGGHGEVYRAVMGRPGGVSTEVALKVLAADVDPNSDPVHRLKDEGRLLGALSHPALLKVYDLVVLDGRVALVTEFVEGEDLHRIIYSDAGVPQRVLVDIVGQVAEALHTAWTTPAPDGRGPMRLVHRDIKPQNVRLGRHGEVKLLDFGIARAVDDVHRESQTQNDILMGSWPYLAPERMLEVPGPLTSAVDVYGLGCLLFEGLAKQRLMEGQSLFGLYRLVDQPGSFGALVQSRIEALSHRVPPELRTLMHRLLAEDPSQRPTAYQAASLCEEVAEIVPGGGLRRWAREREWPERSRDRGPLTDREITEGSLTLSRPAEVHAAAAAGPPSRAGARWMSAPVSMGAPTIPPTSPPPRPAQRSAAAATTSKIAKADPRAPTLMRWEGPDVEEPRAPGLGLPSIAGFTIDHEGRHMAPPPPPPSRSRRPVAPTLVTFALFGVGLGLCILAGLGVWWIGSGGLLGPMASRPEGLAPREVTVPGTEPDSARSEEAVATAALGDHASGASVDPSVEVEVPPEASAGPARAVAPTPEEPLPLIDDPPEASEEAGIAEESPPPPLEEEPERTVVEAPEPAVPPPPVAPSRSGSEVPRPAPVAGGAPDAIAPPPILDSRGSDEDPGPDRSDRSASTGGPPPPPPPAPAQASATPGTLVVQGDATVELRGDFGGFRAGTPLVPGVYQVWADFGEGLEDTGLRSRMAPGGRITVSCSVRVRRCYVSPRLE